MYKDKMFKKNQKDRSKNVTSSVKWSKKNESYLKQLGFLNSKGKAEHNISGLVNMAVTTILEDGKTLLNGKKVSVAELELAFRKACVAERTNKIMRLQQEIQQIVDWKGEK